MATRQGEGLDLNYQVRVLDQQANSSGKRVSIACRRPVVIAGLLKADLCRV